MYKIFLIAIVFSAAGASAGENTSSTNSLLLKMDGIEKILKARVSTTLMDFGDTVVYPRSAMPNGRWNTVPIRDWTSGFYPGILWYMKEMTNDSVYQRAAERWTEGLTPLQFFTGSHDIGFMVYCSFGNAYRLTGPPEYKKVILQTAQTLTTRFNTTVGCIKSWDNNRWQYPVIIDNMMNLELLFWASQNGGDHSLYDIAVRHAETTMRNHFRADGSTYHVLGYDTATGKVLSKGTAQGYSDSSCWARGQAWAMYGFTMTYRFTHDARFLLTAQRVAEYFIDHLPADHVPYWDFNAPKIPNEPRDASAGAIAASGLLELSRYASDASVKEKYFKAAESILSSLSAPPYLNAQSTGRGILDHCVGHRPAGMEIDVSLIYGDYYYIEALMRYQKMLATR
jgi:unsaturated chondroitin disaccharide hydrolase